MSKKSDAEERFVCLLEDALEVAKDGNVEKALDLAAAAILNWRTRAATTRAEPVSAASPTCWVTATSGPKRAL